jgi:hypothetical protein
MIFSIQTGQTHLLKGVEMYVLRRIYYAFLHPVLKLDVAGWSGNRQQKQRGSQHF